VEPQINELKVVSEAYKLSKTLLNDVLVLGLHSYKGASNLSYVPVDPNFVGRTVDLMKQAASGLIQGLFPAPPPNATETHTIKIGILPDQGIPPIAPWFSWTSKVRCSQP
jgi:hypothetical protein